MQRIDSFFFIFIIISTLLIIGALTSIINPMQLLLIRLGFVLLVILMIKLLAPSKSNFNFFIRNTYLLLLSTYFYTETTSYNKLFFSNIDPFLESIELSIFHFNPSIEFSKFFNHPLFSEIMYFAYFSFYLSILLFAIYQFKYNYDGFKKNMFYLSASLFIYYLIFALIPSQGPQFFYSGAMAQVPDGYIFQKAMKLIHAYVEKPTGAFPSSHVGISIIILIISYKKTKNFFYFSLPIVFLLILATVYIKAHYAIDVLGGLLSAPLILFTSKKLYKILPGL